MCYFCLQGVDTLCIYLPPQMIKQRNPHTEKPSREKYNFFTMETCFNIRVFDTC